MSILLKNPLIVTMDPSKRVLSNQSILISDAKITKIAANIKASDACRVIDCTGKVVIPGLINAHTHVAMAPFKGVGHALTCDHIYKLMFPVERRLTADDAYVFACHGITEMLKGGATCFADHYYFMDSVARAVREFGMRAVLGHTLMDVKGPRRGRGEFQRQKAFVRSCKNDDLITACFAPHATETVSRDYLRQILREAKRHGLLVHMHVAQTKEEYSFIKKKYGKTPVKYLCDLGAFEGDFLAAHAIYLDDDDVKILAKNHVNVVFTPSSEIVYDQLPNIGIFLKNKVNVALGTDCVATADLMSPLHEMKKAYYAIKQMYGEKCPVKPIDILGMFTVNAARAVGLGGRVGMIKEGMLADMVVLDMGSAEFNPVHDIYANVVLCSNESMVDLVIINGCVVMQDKKILFADETEIVRESNLRARRLL